MLPGFLTLYTEQSGTGLPARLRRGVAVAAALSAGFTAVYATTALLLAAGLRPVLASVPWLAFAIGVALLGVGAFMLTGHSASLRLPMASRAPRGRGLKAATAYGAAYAVASLSCTVAILLATTAQALATTGVTGMLTVIGVYTLGAATLLAALAISAALASGALARLLRRAGRHLNRAAGALLAATGLYLTVYWAPALTGDTPNQTLARAVGGLAGHLSLLLDRYSTAVAIAATMLLAIAIAVTVGSRRRSSASAALDDCCGAPSRGVASKKE